MTKEIVVTNTRPEHAQGVYDTVRLAYGVPLSEECPTCVNADDVRRALQWFPEGQFVALDGDLVVGMAATMRTHYRPDQPPKRWMEAIGGTDVRNHEPEGDWLYGAEMAVRPDYRKRGIGTKLYEARFNLVRRLGLRGWYAGGVLMGYYRYADQMDSTEYARKVIDGELRDPTVSMQLHRGFQAWGIIENYLYEPEAGNTAVLIVWPNPDFQE